MIRFILGELLYYANCERSPWPQAFYAIKDRWLKRWATPDGVDIQRIDYPCWHCKPDGTYCYCSRCGGSGVYTTRHTRLMRWKLGRRRFHSIHQVQYREWENIPTIVGRIKHQDPGMLGVEAVMWVFLLARDWKHLRMCLTGYRRYGWTLFPLCLLQKVGWAWRSWRDRVRARRQAAAHTMVNRSIDVDEIPF